MRLNYTLQQTLEMQGKLHSHSKPTQHVIFNRGYNAVMEDRREKRMEEDLYCKRLQGSLVRMNIAGPAIVIWRW